MVPPLVYLDGLLDALKQYSKVTWLEADGVVKLNAPGVVSGIMQCGYVNDMPDALDPGVPQSTLRPLFVEGDGRQCDNPPPPPARPATTDGDETGSDKDSNEEAEVDEYAASIDSSGVDAGCDEADPSPQDTSSASSGEAQEMPESPSLPPDPSLLNFDREGGHLYLTLIHSPIPGRPPSQLFQPANYLSFTERSCVPPPSLRDWKGDPMSASYGTEQSVVCLSRKKRQRLSYVHISEGTVRFGVVLAIFQRGGLRLAADLNGEWNLLWARRIKQEEWGRLNKYQHANHFPGTWGIGRKDNLARNMMLMAKRHGDEHYGFHPRTYVLPAEACLLASEFTETTKEKPKRKIFIVKPSAAACGKGIHLIDRMPPRHKVRPCVVQQYLGNPMLLNGRKFDLRLYVGVTSFNPLRIYLYKEGMVRIAVDPYSTGNLRNKYSHLTNYSINKNNSAYVPASSTAETGESNVCKWTLTAFIRHCKSCGYDWDPIWAQIGDVVVKTMLSVESTVSSNMQRMSGSRKGCFELFGFDMLLDANLRVHLLEVNIMPSLNTSSPLDAKIKGNFIADIVTLVGVVPYNRKSWRATNKKEKSARLFKEEYSKSCVVVPPCPLDQLPEPPCQAVAQFWSTLDVTEQLIILETEEEYARRGHFARLFPVALTYPYYSQFFEEERPWNRLLVRWEREKEKAWRAATSEVKEDQPVKCEDARVGYNGRVKCRTRSAPRVGASAAEETAKELEKVTDFAGEAHGPPPRVSSAGVQSIPELPGVRRASSVLAGKVVKEAPAAPPPQRMPSKRGSKPSEAFAVSMLPYTTPLQRRQPSFPSTIMAPKGAAGHPCVK